MYVQYISISLCVRRTKLPTNKVQHSPLNITALVKHSQRCPLFFTLCALAASKKSIKDNFRSNVCTIVYIRVHAFTCVCMCGLQSSQMKANKLKDMRILSFSKQFCQLEVNFSSLLHIYLGRCTYRQI